ncbi:MAG TPA: PLP-dependent aminotransferase family protein [Thermoanaerobaculia bacterium]|nr:PLP-dependent aminotransferase family protein [Thermoanaerobaculia bacterium]
MATAPQTLPSTAELAIARAQQLMRQSTLREMIAMGARPGVLSFAIGLPAEGLFPVEGLSRAAAQLLATDRQSLQYGVPYPPLKAQIVELMRLRGVTCRPEQIFLTSGAQQGMDLLARLLLVPGGRVMLEETVYDGMQMAVKRLEPEILAIPTDLDQGIDADAVERHLAAGPAPAFLYCITDGHNPLGVSLDEAKRRRLAALARQHRMPILEDDAYGFLYYEASPAPPLRAYEDEWVFYLGSFSKILAPGLRQGWIVVPEELVPTLAALKHATDLDTPSFSQRIISAFLAAGELPDHMARLRATYGAQRDALLAALDRRLAGAVRWNRPTAGMFVWVELPERIDTAQLVRPAIEDEQVAFSPGAAFAVRGSRHADHCLRLAFAHLTPEQIETGVERLARVIERALG